MAQSEPTTATDSPQHHPEEKAPGLLPLLAALGIIGFFCLGPTLSPFGHLSYSYLRSLFFDGDLNIVDEATRTDARWPEGILLEPHHETGLPSSPASPGPSLFWTPFFFVGHLAAMALRAWNWPLLADGYNPFYYLGINLGTFFYLVLGGGLTIGAVRRLLRTESPVFLVFAGILASPLLMTGLLDGSLPDTFSFFGAAYFLFEWMEYRKYPRSRNAFMLGLTAGILCLIRPVNGVLCLWPIIDMFLQPRDKRQYPFWDFLGYIAALVFAFSPQLLIWHTQTGSPWPAPQDRPDIVFQPVQWFLYLFSWPDGFLIRYPFFALGLLGLTAYSRQTDRRLGNFLVVSFLAAVLTPGLIAAPWFPREQAPRFAVSALPFAVLGGSYLLRSRWRVPVPAVVAIGGLLVVWTVFCELANASFSLSSLVPSTALMVPRLGFEATASFGVPQAVLVGFLLIGITVSLLINGRIYREITDISANLPLAHSGRRIGIWSVVILAAGLVIYVTNWSQHQILLVTQEGQDAFRVVPNAYNRFGQFKQVGLGLEVGPGASRTLSLSPPYAVSSIHVITRVIRIQDIPWGTPVARFSVYQADRGESVLLEFGEETICDRYLGPDAGLQETAGIYEWSDTDGRIIVGCSCRLDLPRPVIAERLVVENLVADATVSISGIGFRPSPIRVVPPERLRVQSPA
ncbi:MAG: hypothetical protein ABIH23_27610 [bacterium]